MRRYVPKKSLNQQMRENVAAMRGLASTPEQLAKIEKDFPLPELRQRKPKAKREGLSELQEQIRLIKWWDSACKGYGCLPLHLFAIPNGGSRGAIEAVNLKRSGVRPGVPDLFLAVPHAGFHGMFLEMKAENGVVSSEQETAIEVFSGLHYKCCVAWSHMEAIQHIARYFN